MEECKICNLYNLEETIAKDLLESAIYPWEVLPKISNFILELGKKLDEDKYEKEEKTYGLLKAQKLHQQHIFMDQQLYAKMQK